MFFKPTMRASSVLLAAGNIKVGVSLVRRKSDEAIKQATKQIKKSVFISQSTDVFTNLALEQWFFKNMDFTHHHVMMLWRNDPCIVIGRHQNPWVEANVSELDKQGVKIARRSSGGGTVYHDLGNLNLTFFTPNGDYNRKNNLEIISRALYREWGLKSTVSDRDDINVRGNFKISGTAAKLTRTNSYHHCTLLVDVNKAALGNALLKNDLGIESNATKSTQSSVLNLKDENHHVNMTKLMSSVGWEYLRTGATELTDHGLQHASKQNGFKYINPSDGWYPELTTIRDELSSWDWVYGKTPQFSSNVSFALLPDTKTKLKLSMSVEGGKIDDVTLQVPPGLSAMGFHGDAQVCIPNTTQLKGQKFTAKAVENLKQLVPKQDTKDNQQALIESVN